MVVVVLEAECFLLEYLCFWLRQPNLEFFTFCQPIAPLPSIALEIKGELSASIQACALKLIWRLLQRVSSLLHRDVF